MLPQQHLGEAIGVCPGLALFIRDLVELAKCLANRLAYFHRENARAPSLHLRRFGGQRMPEPHRLRCVDIDRIPRSAGHALP